MSRRGLAAEVLFRTSSMEEYLGIYPLSFYHSMVRGAATLLQQAVNPRTGFPLCIDDNRVTFQEPTIS